MSRHPRFPLRRLGVVLILLMGCGVDYYVHVGLGQVRVLRGRQGVGRALAAPDTSPEARRKLVLVQEVKGFAVGELGLVGGGSYETVYDTGRRPASWNLSAAPRTALAPHTWSFPIVGAVPYLGFFDRQAAVEERNRLLRQGYDTNLRPVSAYSTLGWFDDPLFSDMLRYADANLANVVIHELLHATVYRPGDTEFNESLATFVGGRGAAAWLAHRFGPESEELARYLAEERDGERFQALIAGLLAELEALYASGATEAEMLEEKRRAIARARQRYRTMRAAGEMETDAWDGFLTRRLNNAVLLSFRRYHRDLDVFARVYEAAGREMPRALAVFRQAAEADEPRRWLRAWLDARQPSADR